jgi:putative addiction module killer protein
MEGTPREIRRYITATGKVPFSEWLDSLKDRKTRAIIKRRLDRVEEGNLGDCKPVGGSVFELKVDYGSGYRIYFGQTELTVVLLLCGGDKKTQEQDIKRAKEYWTDYEGG